MAETEVVPSYEESRRTSLQVGGTPTAPPPPSLVHHVFKNRELSVELSSHAKSPTSIPVFYPLSVIEGSAALTLAREQTLHQISITAECGVEPPVEFRSGSGGSAYDRNHFKPFWSVTTVVFPLEQNSRKKASLPAGVHVFPFRFEIPKSTKPFHDKFFGSDESLLPPTFLDPRFPYAIQYVLLTEIKYGFMKIDRILPILFRHIPITQPDRPPSPAITRAYLFVDPMPTPSTDPPGYIRESVVIAGKLFNRPFILDCQVFFPRPTAYTIGTRINFFVKVVSPPNEEETPTHIQAADLLLLPNSTSIYLEKLARFDGRFSGNFIDNVATAKTWQRRDDVDGRLLQGEIKLPSGAQTDFVFPCIELSHRVSLAICAPGIVISTTKSPFSQNRRLPSSRQYQTVLFFPIKLVNASRAGDPMPPSYAPVPGYNEESSPRSLLTARTRRGLDQESDS